MANEDSVTKPLVACLYVTKGASAGTLIELHGQMVAGRDPGCDIVIVDDSISRDHALFWENDGRVTLSDVASTNGTSVNGVPISAPVALEDGDAVRLGGVMLEFIERAEARDLPTRRETRECYRGGSRQTAGCYSESAESGSRRIVDWMPRAVSRYSAAEPSDSDSP